MQSSLSELFYCAKELNRNNKKGRVNVENEKLFTIIKSTIWRGQFQGVWFDSVLIDWIMGLLLLRLEKADPTKSQMRVTDFIISLDSCLSPEHRLPHIQLIHLVRCCWPLLQSCLLRAFSPSPRKVKFSWSLFSVTYDEYGWEEHTGQI